MRQQRGMSALIGLLLGLTPALAEAQEMPDLGKLASFVRWGGLLLSVFVILGSVVLVRIIGDLAERLSRRFTSHRLLIQKFESGARFFVYLLTGAICVGLSIQLDQTALAVIGGALAFAVGFAMRDLVAALIAGITILFDRPFQVGDRVAYAGEYGDIISIGLRSVRMKTLDHNIVTIPNNKVLTDVTSSGNYGVLEMQVALDFYLPLDRDLTRAMELVREACLTSPYVYLEQPVPVSLTQIIAEDAILYQIKARPYVFDTKHEKALATDVHRRVSEAFREHGILPPVNLG